MAGGVQDLEALQHVDCVPILQLIDREGPTAGGGKQSVGQRGQPRGVVTVDGIWKPLLTAKERGLAGMDEDAGAGGSLQLVQRAPVIEVVVRHDDALDVAGRDAKAPELAEHHPRVAWRASIDQRHPVPDQCEHLAAKPPQLVDAGCNLHQSSRCSTWVSGGEGGADPAGSGWPGGRSGTDVASGGFTVGRRPIAITTMTAITAKI